MTKNQRRLIWFQRVEPAILLLRNRFYFSALLGSQSLPERFLAVYELAVDDHASMVAAPEQAVVLPVVVAEVSDTFSCGYISYIVIAAQTDQADRRVDSTKRGLQRSCLLSFPPIIPLLADVLRKLMNQIPADDRELRLEAVDVVDGL